MADRPSTIERVAEVIDSLRGSTLSMGSEPTVHPCPRCGARRWHRERGPDCMYAVCGRCDTGWDIGWGLRPDYFPADAVAAAEPPEVTDGK